MTDRLTRLTTLAASLQKGVIGTLGFAEGLPNVLDDPLLGLHRILPLAFRTGPSLVKRSSLFERDPRDLREMRDGSEISSSQVAPVVHVLLVSFTIHEQQATCCETTPE